MEIQVPTRNKETEENKCLIYLNKTWLNVGESAGHIWTDGSRNPKQMAPVSRGERLIVLHAGSEAGWVPNALLILRTRGAGSFDYHQLDNHNLKMVCGAGFPK